MERALQKPCVHWRLVGLVRPSHRINLDLQPRKHATISLDEKLPRRNIPNSTIFHLLHWWHDAKQLLHDLQSKSIRRIPTEQRIDELHANGKHRWAVLQNNQCYML